MPQHQAVDFVTSGLSAATGQDDRVVLNELIAAGTSAFKTAAGAALAGSDSDSVELPAQPRLSRPGAGRHPAGQPGHVRCPCGGGATPTSILWTFLESTCAPFL